MLTARKLIQGKLHDIEMSIRCILRGFGLKRADHATHLCGTDPRVDRRSFRHWRRLPRRC